MTDGSITVSLELRALNSRYLDYSSKLARQLTHLDLDAQKLVKKKCIRGRMTLTASVSFDGSANGRPMLNESLLTHYLDLIEKIQQKTRLDHEVRLQDLLMLPDIFQPDCEPENDIIRTLFLDALTAAVTELTAMRRDEGASIRKDFEKRLALVDQLVDDINQHAVRSRSDELEKYRSRIQDMCGDLELDENRLYQEIAILAEKRDITEELIRLKSHIKLYQSYYDEADYSGKKLNFLLQEMGREVNTIGSKTDNVKISHTVVSIKDELEKMREQVQNIL